MRNPRMHWRASALNVGAYLRRQFPDAVFDESGWAPVQCPLPTHAGHPAPLMIRSLGGWQCLGPCGRGDELAFVMRHCRCDRVEAVHRLIDADRGQRQ